MFVLGSLEEFGRSCNTKVLRHCYLRHCQVLRTLACDSAFGKARGPNSPTKRSTGETRRASKMPIRCRGYGRPGGVGHELLPGQRQRRVSTQHVVQTWRTGRGCFRDESIEVCLLRYQFWPVGCSNAAKSDSMESHHRCFGRFGYFIFRPVREQNLVCERYEGLSLEPELNVKDGSKRDVHTVFKGNPSFSACDSCSLSLSLIISHSISLHAENGRATIH